MNPNRSVSRWSRHTVALGLTLVLFAQPVLASAPPELAPVSLPEVPTPEAPLPEAPLPEAQALMIEIIDGEGALNNIRQRTAREPIVQVEDQNHKPVAGALVLFTINGGPGGAGAAVNGLATLSVRTGLDGRAQLTGLKPNNVAGQFTITVSASLGAVMAAAIIIHQQNQTGAEVNSSPQQGQAQPGQPGTSAPTIRHSIYRSSVFKTALIVGGTVAGGVIVGVLATRGANGASITAGAGSVTHP